MQLSTKIWLVTLNEGHSMIETVFSGIWNETVLVTAAHTDKRSQQYTLLQCNDEPDLLAIILGNCSLDADDNPSPRLMELITHKELFRLDIDVNELPLDSGKITISFSESQPADLNSLPGKGIWGVSTSWSWANHDAGKPENKMWIQIAPSDDADRLRQVGAIKNFSKILESRVASQTAE